MKTNCFIVALLLPCYFFSQNHTFTCEYLPNGKRKQCTYEYNGIQVWETTIYIYNAQEQLVKTLIYTHQSEEDTLPGETYYHYDASGRLIRVGNYHYTYAPFGKLKKMTYRSGKLSFENTFFYDSKNRLVRGRLGDMDRGCEMIYFNITFPEQPLLKLDTMTLEPTNNFFGNRFDSLLRYNNKNQLISSEYRRFDNKGNRIQRLVWDQTQGEGDKEIVYEEEYDEKGNYKSYNVILRKRNTGLVIWTKKIDVEGKVIYDSEQGSPK